jgi:hypothetical protein
MAAKEISVKKYVVRLSGEERERLEALLRKGKSPAQRMLKARILLKADVSEAGEGWSDSRIIKALDTSASMIYRVRRQLDLPSTTVINGALEFDQKRFCGCREPSEVLPRLGWRYCVSLLRQIVAINGNVYRYTVAGTGGKITVFDDVAPLIVTEAKFTIRQCDTLGTFSQRLALAMWALIQGAGAIFGNTLDVAHRVLHFPCSPACPIDALYPPETQTSPRRSSVRVAFRADRHVDMPPRPCF